MFLSKIVEEDVDNIIKDNDLLNLDDSTFFITGISGTIGGYFFKTVYQLNHKYGKNHKIYGLLRKENDKFDEFKKDKNIVILYQDVTEPVKIDEKVDYIIHTAGPTSPKIMKEDPVGTNLANILGTINTVKIAKENNAKAYLFISSREVYGEADENTKYFTEDGKVGYIDHTNVRNCYAESKRNAENLLISYNKEYGLNVKAIRLAHTFGPGINIYDGKVQSDFLKNYIHNEDIIMKSKGDSVRTYTYVSDAVSAMFKVILKSPKEEVIYNISDEANEITIKGLAETISEIGKENGKDIKVIMEIQDDKNVSFAPFSKGIVCSKKVRGLGYNNRYNVKEGFERTIKHIEETNEYEKALNER